ncbi:MAG TPA: AIR synthase related protein [Candidatus Bathyarchaeia archaeon]|nr:AIR synthase related protein [Candidatus Bathyarchaeia archaeon]
MKEGKLPLNLLEQMISSSKNTNPGIIQGPKIGCDVAVLDYEKAIQKVKQFYQSKEDIYLVFKTDPITFPTPNPGKYAVIVNANDIVTSGALPFGFNATIIMPTGSTQQDIFEIQKGIESECKKNDIYLLGGHTEISSSAKTPIISGAMLGFVPKDYYVPREIHVGDVVICVGWCATEGLGIIASEGYAKLKKYISETSLKKLIKLGENISIIKTALDINKKIQPGLMHDATEGGILGAIYETIIPEGFGLELITENFPVSEEAKELCTLLRIDPLRLLSSGTLLIVTTESKAQMIINDSTIDIPIRIIGKIREKSFGAKLNAMKIDPPGPDAIIAALRKIEEGNF